VGDGPAAHLLINPRNAAGTNFTNHGTMRAANGGTLELSGSGAGAFSNLGIIEALDGSQIIHSGSASLVETASGTLTAGTYRAVSTGNGASVALPGPAGGAHTIGTAAVVELSGAGSNISIGGSSLENSLAANQGTLRVLNGRAYATAAAMTDFSNTGTLEVGTGASATFNRPYSGVGASGGGHIVFNQALRPGTGPAAVNFANNVTFGTSALLDIEIGGTTLGSQYDHIEVGGDLALGGTLGVAFINGYQPQAGHAFDILNWGGLSGGFTNLQLPALGAGLNWNTSQLYTDGILSVVGPNIVYSNDFEANTAGFNTSGRNSYPTDAQGFASPNQSQHLGLFFGNQSTTLTLTNLVPGGEYQIAFDLFIGKSWDGNSTFLGPNTWELTLNGAEPTTLVDTTFLNLFPTDGILNNFTQNYSDSNPIGPGSNAPFTGADVAFTHPEPVTFYERYAIYYFSHGEGNPVLNFVADSSTVTLTFAGGLDQEDFDEFWALDNVVVYELSAPMDGDYNEDGIVDAADYVVWRKMLGQMGPNLAADGNGNGIVDFGDYMAWRSDFGHVIPPGAVGGEAARRAAVPEPGAILLASIATAICVSRRPTRSDPRLINPGRARLIH
jgi:hypothetical protein